MSKIKPKWYIGIGVFVLVVLFLMYLATPIQANWGMWGLAVTELILLLFALLPVFLFKWKLSEVFPLKKIRLKQLLAVLLLYAATFIVSSVVAMITSYFFPNAIEVSKGIASFSTSTPFVISLLVMAVLPAICEEALHRGFILHTVRLKKHELLTMLIMAVIFGVFHLDFYRFLPTAILGFILTYIMIKTENFLLPVLYHLFHNAVSVATAAFASNSLSSEAMSQVNEMPLASVGTFLILSALAPVLYYFGSKFISPNQRERSPKTKWIVLALTFILLAAGFLVMSQAAKAIEGLTVDSTLALCYT